MDVIKTYIPKRYRSKKLVNSISGSGGTTVTNSGGRELSPSAFVDSDTFFFFVPYRLVWDNWKRFMGEQRNPGDSTSFLVSQSR